MEKAGEDFSEWFGGWWGSGRCRTRGIRAEGFRASTALSEKVSKELKKRGFKFVGPVIVYAWMQAAGMVNDHAVECFRRKPVEKLGAAGLDGVLLYEGVGG